MGLRSSTSGSAGDLVARPQAGMQWTVEIYPPGSRKAETKTKPGKTKNRFSTEPDREEKNVMGHNLRQETKAMNDGHTLIRYASEGLVLYIDPRTGEPAIEGSSDEDAYGGPLRASLFDEFSWVEARWHQEQPTFAGTLCDVFVGPWPAESAYPSRCSQYYEIRPDRLHRQRHQATGFAGVPRLSPALHIFPGTVVAGNATRVVGSPGKTQGGNSLAPQTIRNSPVSTRQRS